MLIAQDDENLVITFGGEQIETFKWGEIEFPTHSVRTFWRKNKLFVNTDYGKLKTRQIFELVNNGKRIAIEIVVLGLGESYRRKVRRYFVRKDLIRIIEQEL